MNQIHQAYDVVILGAGPAGIQAAIHAARKKVSVLVLGKQKKSAAMKAHIENYCCIHEKVSGEELIEHGREQAQKAGAHFLDEDVVGIVQVGDDGFQIDLESQRQIHAKAIVFAMGVARNRLNVPGEKEFISQGVSYCVDCDGMFYKNQVVTVVGNESAAASGALTLLMIAREVHFVYQQLDVNDILKSQIEQSEVVRHPGRWVRAIQGKEQVEAVVLDNDEIISTDGVFIELGAKGAVDLAATLGVALDSESYRYIVTDKRQQTNIDGVFAAGDICGPPWQVAKAVGEGCVAGLEAASYAKRKKSGK